MNQNYNSDNESWEDGTEVLDNGIKNSQLIINSHHQNSDNEEESNMFANL